MPRIDSDHIGSRFEWVDYSRGLGILLVVYGHVIRGLQGSGILAEDFFHVSDLFVYSFHMPLFFILSGIFFLHSYNKGFSNFITSKAKTLIYPYIIWSLLQTVIEILLSRYTNGKVGLESIFTCLIIPRAQFWFLYALVLINVINFLLFKISLKYGLLISSFIWLIYALAQPSLGVFENSLKYLVYFNVGIVISQHISRFQDVFNSGLYLAINLFVFIISEYILLNALHQHLLLTFLTSFSGAILIMQIGINLSNLGRLSVFSRFGKESMPIYLTHILVASGTRIFLIKLLHINSSVIHIIVGTALGLIIPYYLYTYIRNKSYLLWLYQYPKKTYHRTSIAK